MRLEDAPLIHRGLPVSGLRLDVYEKDLIR